MINYEKFPSFNEFYNNVTAPLFDQEDIAFQKKIALKIGFTSWEDYLKDSYQFDFNLYDNDAIANDFSKGHLGTGKILGSVPLIFNKYSNKELLEEIAAFEKKLKAHPINIQKRFRKFDAKLHHMLEVLCLDKLKDNIHELESVRTFIKDAKNQFSTLNSEPLNEGQQIMPIEDSVSLPYTNAIIKKLITPNFYFPEKAHILKQIHSELVSIKFIKPNDDFEKTFETEIKPPTIKPTLWLTESTKLFYLLYRLNNKKEFFTNGFSIDKIANQLFSFKVPKSAKVMRTIFTKAFKKFEDEDYLNKKMPEITRILKNLSI